MRVSPWPGTPVTSPPPERASSTPTPSCGPTALGALERLGVLTDAELTVALADTDAVVRRRAATIAAGPPGRRAACRCSTTPTPSVVEVAAWAYGEREAVADDVLDAVDRAAPARAGRPARAGVDRRPALGAIGDDRGLAAILAATTDKPAIRRRAVLALAPFLDPDHPRADDVAAALERALTDRDWQVRQAAEDLAPTTRPTRSSALQIAYQSDGRRDSDANTARRPGRGRAAGRTERYVLVRALEADARVEAVGGLAGRTAGEADVLGAAAARLVERRRG